MEFDNLSNTSIVILGLIVLVALLIAVAFAAFKHALVRQLESKNKELKEVLEQNTLNISQKKKELVAKKEAYKELKESLQDLSNRHKELKKDYQDANEKLNMTTTNFEKSHQDYLQSLNIIANNQKEYELELSGQKNNYEKQLLDLRKESDREINSFKENYAAEFEHLKRSHKRLVQANQTLSKSVDNLGDERDFYRTEFETLRNFLHDSQMTNVKSLIEEQNKKAAGDDSKKVINIPKKKK